MLGLPKCLSHAEWETLTGRISLDQYTDSEQYEVVKARIKIRKILWENVYPNTLRGIIFSSNLNYMINKIDRSLAQELLSLTQRVMKNIDDEIQKTVDEITRDSETRLTHIAKDLVQKEMQNEDFILLQKSWDEYGGKTKILA